MSAPIRADVHQHLWPPAFIDALRARRNPPFLRGWTLYLAGEPPYEVNPADHDPIRRSSVDPDTDRILLGLSSPLGIEELPANQAAPLLDAWHQGVRELPAPFEAWASVSHLDPDLSALNDHLAQGFVGLQVPATRLATPAALNALLPTLGRGGRLHRATAGRLVVVAGRGSAGAS